MVVWAAIVVIVGASFTEFTVRVKKALELSEPSVTVRMTFDAPYRLATGVSVTVRLVPVPPITMFETGNNVVSEDVAVTASEPLDVPL